MISIELIKFEAQDVITTSVAIPVAKPCKDRHVGTIVLENDPNGNGILAYCTACGNSATGTDIGVNDIPLP